MVYGIMETSKVGDDEMLREESKQLSFYSSLYEKIPETHILKRIEKK